MMTAEVEEGNGRPEKGSNEELAKETVSNKQEKWSLAQCLAQAVLMDSWMVDNCIHYHRNQSVRIFKEQSSGYH